MTDKCNAQHPDLFGPAGKCELAKNHSGEHRASGLNYPLTASEWAEWDEMRRSEARTSLARKENRAEIANELNTLMAEDMGRVVI